MLLNTLLFLALGAFAYYLPGRLLLACLPGEPAPEERFPVAVGLGVAMVHSLSVLWIGVWGLFGPHFLGRGEVLAVATTLSIMLALIARLRAVSLRPRWPSRPSRRLVALWVATVLAAGFFLVHFDHDQLAEESCIVRASTQVNFNALDPSLLAQINDGATTEYTSDPRRGMREDRNGFLRDNQSQRIGPTILTSPAVAMFGVFGYRFVYALQGLLLPILGFLIGRRFFAYDWAAWAVAILLALSPYALDVQAVDENFSASIFGTLALWMLLRERPSALGAGIALSLFLSIRQEAALVLPLTIAFFILARERFSRRPIVQLFAALVVFGAPWLILFGFRLLGGGPVFEGAIDRPLMEHSFFGIQFESRVLLNWPFISEPLRSPYNAWPTLVAFPVDLLRRFGWLGAMLIPAGVVALFRSDRKGAWLLVGWFAAMLLVLLVQSRWVEPNKMGIPATVLAPAVLAIVGGFVFLRDKETFFLTKAWILLISLAVPVSFWLVVRHWEAPVDERVEASGPDYAWIMSPRMPAGNPEHKDYVDWDRDHRRPGLLPSYPRAHFHPAVLRLRWRHFVDELTRPSVRDWEGGESGYLASLVMGEGYRVSPLRAYKLGAGGGAMGLRLFSGDEHGEGPTTLVNLDLTRPPVLVNEPLAPAPRTKPFDMNDSGVLLVSGFRVSWSAHPINLLAYRDRFGTVHILLLPFIPGPFRVPDWLRVEERSAEDFPAQQVSFRLPVGTVIRLMEARTFIPLRFMGRYIVNGEDENWISSPFTPSV